MNLGKSINNLLKRYEQVRVDGIGLFSRKQNSANFDKENNIYLPPITYIEFDSHTEEGGYNLTHYIQQQLQLDQQAAIALIQSAVADVKEQLAQKGQAKLENLGFLIAYGDSFVFKPLDLSGFNFQPIANTVPVEPSSPEIETTIPEIEPINPEVKPINPEIEPIIPEIETVIPELEINLVELPEEEHKPEETTRISESKSETEGIEEITEEEPEVLINNSEDILSLDNPKEEQESDYSYEIENNSNSNNSIWYIASAVIILISIAAAFLLNPDLNNRIFGNKNEMVAVSHIPQKEVSVLDSLTDSLATESLPVDSLAAVNVLDSDTLQATAALAETQVEDPAEWQIIIGTPKTMEQAQEQVKKLHAKGYAHVSALDSKLKTNRKKVVWKKFVSKDEAEKELVKVQKTIEQSAWLDRIKN